jgi:hypothetical protein
MDFMPKGFTNKEGQSSGTFVYCFVEEKFFWKFYACV